MNGKPRTFPRFAADRYFTSHQLDQFPCQGQPDACAFIRAGRGIIGLVKPVENKRNFGLGDADAGIPYIQLQPAHLVFIRFPDPYLYFSAGRGKLDGIRQEVGNDLLEPVRIKIHFQGRGFSLEIDRDILLAA